MNDLPILTTTVGSYTPIDWLANTPNEQALLDAVTVVIQTQRRCGIDLPTDGELYRFAPNHPDANGMIDYFVGVFMAPAISNLLELFKYAITAPGIFGAAIWLGFI